MNQTFQQYFLSRSTPGFRIMSKWWQESPSIKLLLGLSWFAIAFLWYRKVAAPVISEWDWLLVLLCSVSGMYWLWLAYGGYMVQNSQ